MKAELKSFNTALVLLLLILVLSFQKCRFFAKKGANFSKIKRNLVLQGIISEIIYVFILAHQFSNI